MRKGLRPLSISVAAMFLSMLNLKLANIPVHAATQSKYATEVVVPIQSSTEIMPQETQQAIQNALDKKAAEGWQLQTMTVLHESTWTSPMYVLTFKK